MSDFPEHWQLLPLEDVMGAIIDYRGKTPKKTDQGIPLITAKIVKGGRILEPAEFIAEEDYDSWMVRGLPEVGDVVVTSEAPLGEVAQLTDSNVALAQRIVTLRGKAGILNNDFLLCAMQSAYVQHQLESRASGSTVKGIKQSELRKVLLPIPPEDEQIEIANHLKTLSNKIELNRQTNQTLEQIAQAIFKSWFIDFEPVKAKIEAKQNGQDPERAAMRAISGKTDEELDAHGRANAVGAGGAGTADKHKSDWYKQLEATAAVFPDELKNSELGEIPKGWRTGTLDDLCMLNANSWTKKNEPDEVWYVDLANTKNGIIEKIQHYKWSDSPSRARRILKAGDTIVGTVRPGNRSFALIGKGDKQLTASTGFAVLTPKKSEYLEYIYIAATSDSNVDRLEHLADGGAYPAVRADVVTQMEAVIPSGQIIEKFSDITRSILSHRENNFEQNAVLADYRDSLLPKLLSGEIETNNKQNKEVA